MACESGPSAKDLVCSEILLHQFVPEITRVLNSIVPSGVLLLRTLYDLPIVCVGWPSQMRAGGKNRSPRCAQV